MTYEEALAYLEDTSSFGIKPGLERIQALMQALGNPERDYKIIHVTGTNGKGSVTTYISYALFTSGLRVGRFTSPHLESYTERIDINDVQISKDAFGELINRVCQGVEQIIADGVEPPTQFEILTAAAFLFFKEQGVDYAVVEAGLGGLLDSTNIVKPIVSVITNVTLDHQAYCGDTVEEIAKHKAGIIKEGVPIVTAAQGGPLRVIEEAAKDKHAPLYIFNRKFGIDSRSVVPGGQIMTISAVDAAPAMLFTTMAGVHQSVNLACALQAVRLVMEQDDAISEETMREGFARATWAGRFEIKKALDRTFIFDGAHNPAGVEELIKIVKQHFSKDEVTVLVSILKDKDRVSMFRKLNEISSSIVLTSIPNNPRASTAKELYDHVENKKDFEYEEDPIKAYNLALSKKRKLTVCCGSFYILIKLKEGLNG